MASPLVGLTLELYRKCSPRMVLRSWREGEAEAVSIEPLAVSRWRSRRTRQSMGFPIVTNCCRGTCRAGRESVANGRAGQPSLLVFRTRHRPPGSAL